MSYIQITRNFIVKTYDIDYAGHVSNIVYIRWLEDMRLEMLREHYPLEQQMSEGYVPVLVRTNIAYKKPIFLFDPVTATMRVDTIRRASFSLSAEFIARQEICSTVSQEMSFVNRETARLIPIPDSFRQAVTQHPRHLSAGKQ